MILHCHEDVLQMHLLNTLSPFSSADCFGFVQKRQNSLNGLVNEKRQVTGYTTRIRVITTISFFFFMMCGSAVN